MVSIFTKVIYLGWGIFFLYWIISAWRSSEPRQRSETILSRLVFLLLLGIAIGLITFDPLFLGPLLWRFVPESLGIYLSGTAIMVTGLFFAIWARLHLGRSWSSRVAIAENQRLVCTGPYRIVRNPIYSGGLIAVIGTAIIIGQMRGLLAILFVLLAFLKKIKVEEAMLRERFGPEYLDYQSRVKALIPFIY